MARHTFYKTEYDRNGRPVYIGRGYAGAGGAFVRHGKGTLFFPNGTRYEGDFEDGIITGRGRHYSAGSLTWYEGEFLNGQYHGQGRLFDENQLVFEGEFQRGSPNGPGREYYLGGSLLFEGAFLDNRRHGQGRLYRPDGTLHYEGGFDRGLRQGWGKEYYANGALQYEGGFENGKPSGEGRLYYPSGGLCYKGLFREGFFHGLGTRLDETGSVTFSGEFRDGEPVVKEAAPAPRKQERSWRKMFRELRESVTPALFKPEEENAGAQTASKPRAPTPAAPAGTAGSGTAPAPPPMAAPSAVPVVTVLPDLREEEDLSREPENTTEEEAELSELLPSEEEEEASRAGETTPEEPEEQDLPEAEELDALLEELESLVGLEEVKRELRAQVHWMQVQREREARGLPAMPLNKPLLFVGRAGMGKTTVARLYARICGALGVLSRGSLTVTDRAGLIAGDEAATLRRTEEVLSAARGGALLVREVWDLVRGPGDLCGRAAMERLEQQMEESGGDCALILSGAPENMARFLEERPELAARCGRLLTFRDFELPELLELLARLCRKNGYSVDPACARGIRQELETRLARGERGCASARYIRRVFEKLTMAQSDRLAASDLRSLETEALSRLTGADLDDALEDGAFDPMP